VTRLRVWGLAEDGQKAELVKRLVEAEIWRDARGPALEGLQV
jgi:hypothetical protein